MVEKYEDFVQRILHEPGYKCPVCGSMRYVTDHGNHEITIHCSSPAARFWDFERGTVEQMEAKRHWDGSRQDIFFSMEDLLKFVAERETNSSSNPNS
jgi:hypothetical protein